MHLNATKIIVIAVILAVILTIAIILAMIVFPWGFISVGSWLAPNPPKPEIKYGEFPFVLIYELDGEVKVIQDVVVCEFDGFKSHGEAGKYRKWKSHLKSGKERITLLNVDNTLEFYFNYGDPENYMGDPQSGRYGEDLSYDLSYIPFIKKENGIIVADSGMPADKVWEKYKLKIIDWKYTPPIKNSFV